MEIIFHGCNNTRDLGGISTTDGKKIASRRLIRSGTLYRMNSVACRKLETQYQVRTVIDLRTPSEIDRHPLPSKLKIPIVNIPLSEHAMLGIIDDSAGITHKIRAVVAKGMTEAAFMNETYRNLISGKNAVSGYRRIFDILLDSPDGATLFFCEQGRDRTGMAATMILSALGVSIDDIRNDYLISPPTKKEFALIDVMRKLRLASEPEATFAKEFVSPSVSRFDYAVCYLEKQYGSIQEYLSEAVGLKKNEIEKLKANFLR